MRQASYEELTQTFIITRVRLIVLLILLVINFGTYLDSWLNINRTRW